MALPQQVVYFHQYYQHGKSGVKQVGVFFLGGVGEAILGIHGRA